MLRKIIAVDGANADKAAQSFGLPFFPLADFRRTVCGPDGGVDVIETLVSVIRRVPEDDSPEAVATAHEQYSNKVYALEMNGAKVIECPAKRSQSTGTGYKQSDDFRLMISCLSTCLRLKPDYLVLVGGDGDFRPMIEELRASGIRTEVVSMAQHLANDLKRVAVNVIELETIFSNIGREVR